MKTPNLTEARSSVDRIKDDLSACDGLICELEEALSRVEALFPEVPAETVPLPPYQI